MKRYKTYFKIAMLAGCLLIPCLLRAQLATQYTQYTQNMLAVNSAYASSKNAMNFVLISRNQWVGIEGAPRSSCFTFMSPIFKQVLGLGFSYVRDEIGPLTTDNFFVDLAYKVKLHTNGYLCLGIKGGIDIKKANLRELNPLDANDYAYMNDLRGKVTPNFGAGVFYYNRNFYLGVSIPKLHESELSVDGMGEKIGIAEIKQHLYVVSGLVLRANEEWKLKPSILLKKVENTPLACDISANAMYRNRMSGGISYRIDDSFSAQFQIKLLGNLWLGYSYEYTTSPLRKINTGTHEIMLSFDVSVRKDDIIKSPRFF